MCVLLCCDPCHRLATLSLECTVTTSCLQLLTACFLHQVAMPGVTVVRHSSYDRSESRHDTALHTALLDIGLLSAASRVIGAAQSTFSYLIYARARARA